MTKQYDELTAEIDGAETELEAARARIVELNESNLVLRGSYNGMASAWRGERKKRQELEAEHDEARARIAELEAERDAAKNTVASLNEHRGELEAELKDERRWVDQHISERDGEELRANQCEAQLAAVRTALNAAPDSDLASLAETVMRQRRALASTVRVVANGGMVADGAYELAQSILEEGDDHDPA